MPDQRTMASSASRISAAYVHDALCFADYVIVDVQLDYTKNELGNVRNGHVEMGASKSPSTSSPTASSPSARSSASPSSTKATATMTFPAAGARASALGSYQWPASRIPATSAMSAGAS